MFGVWVQNGITWLRQRSQWPVPVKMLRTVGFHTKRVIFRLAVELLFYNLKEGSTAWRWLANQLHRANNSFQNEMRSRQTFMQHILLPDDWLTVHRSIHVTLVNFQLDAQNSYLFIYNTFIKILYMFRALPRSSSGGLRRNCIYEFFLNRCTG